ncbi:MAG: nucleoid-associated protein [Verrucomicrobiota bacterium]
MSLTVNFSEAELMGMGLAKVGNPQRQEGLVTSQSPCKFSREDADLLTHCFLKSFRQLEQHKLEGGKDNPLAGYAEKLFADWDALLDVSASIARHLYSNSNHPNIKSGDLCVALLDGILVDGAQCDGISIIKSESKVPFLQVTAEGEDLQLTTQQGIYPDKIDKGCLILNHGKDDGYVIYLFDRSGNTQFWSKDFVNAVPVQNEEYLTKRYTDMCNAFAKSGEKDDEMRSQRAAVAKKAVSYMAETDDFNIDELQEVALEAPQMAEEFSAFKKNYEEEKVGVPLEENFAVSKKEAKKAERKIQSKMNLDVGVEMKFSPGFQKSADNFVDKGYDEEKRMNYIKIYYHEEL